MRCVHLILNARECGWAVAVHSQVVDAGEAMSNIKVTEKVFNQYA